MTIRTAAELKTNMPIGTAKGTSVQDIHDFVESAEEWTTQAVVAVTSTTRTIALTENKRTFTYDNAAAGTFTIPNNAPAGFEFAIGQIGAGQAAVAVTGGNLRHPDGHTKTSKQWAMVYCKVYANAGTSPQVFLTGETAL